MPVNHHRPLNRPRERLLWLDSLRGFAILGVVLVHCGERPLSSTLLAHAASAGQYGVQLFFIVSAITISMTYRQHLKRYGASAISASAWLIRRIFRIWPLFAIAAVLYTIEDKILVSHLGEMAAPTIHGFDVVTTLLFISPWIPTVHTAVPGGWSICVEAIFYSFFPILMIGRGKPYFLGILGFFAMILLAIAEFFNYRTSGIFAIINNSFFYFWPPTQLPVILIGCIFFFVFLDDESPVRQPNPWLLGVLFLGLSSLGLILGTTGNVSPGLAPSILALAFCCLALLARTDRFQLITNRWISNIGICSYSIYLVHFAVIDLLRLVLKALGISKVQAGIIFLAVIYISVLAVSYYIASWSRRLIELPSIEIGRRLSVRLLVNARLITAAPQQTG